MGKYSTDSDSDQSSKHKRKHRRRSRSSSSSSSSSSHRKRSNKYSKARRRHYSRSRSRGRDKTSKNYRRRSSSRDRDKRRSYRSRRSRSPSSDRSKRRGRSTSRDKSRSSRSRSSSQQSNRTSKFPSSMPERFQTITIKDDCIGVSRFKESVLDEINADSFTPKTFTSQKENKLKNIIIDITTDTIQIPSISDTSSNLLDSVFHSTITLDQEARFDRWVKKLYTMRQKAISDLQSNSIT